jgi:Transposase IS66 family.
MNQRVLPANLTPEDWAATPATVRAWIDELSRTVQALEERLRDLEHRLNQNSRNSSQPPALDRKANQAKPARRRHRGAKRGHAKMERAWVAQPDQVLAAPLTTCSHCQADLQTVIPERIVRRQVTELPEVRPLVIETHQVEAHCPVCQTLQRGRLPPSLAAPRAFGPRLEATVVYLRQQQHLSSERTSQTLTDLFGLELSEGGQASILARAGAAAEPVAETIRARIQQSAVVGCDETGARLDGRVWWQWVFVGADAIYHIIVRRRSASVIQSVMGDAQVEVWVSDCWKPQFHAPAQHFQLCLAHQVRNLQGLIDRCPRLPWARAMQRLFRTAMHLAKRRTQLTERGFARQVQRLERRLDVLLLKEPRRKLVRALFRRFVTHRDKLLLFLHDPRVPFHNNACERALRPAVIHRKVIGGFRSEWGAHAYAALASVIDTAKLRGQPIFPTLVNLMGTPILPYFTP